MPTSPTNGTLARLWLVRHGQTDWNAAGRVQGQTPTELNAEGRREAADLAEILARSRHVFAACYASDLPRALQTAAILTAKLGGTPVAVPALRERSFGPLEGSYPEQIRAARAAAGLSDAGDLARWYGVPGVETNEALWARTAPALAEIANRHPGQDVLVVTHGGVMASALYHTLGIPDAAPRRFPMSNGIVAILQCHPQHFSLVTLADLLLLAGDAPAPDTALMPPSD